MDGRLYCWMAAFTMVLVLVGVGTYLILKNQLREMHEGGTETHELAVQAKNQADASKIQSEYTVKLADAATQQVTQWENGVRETHALA